MANKLRVPDEIAVLIRKLHLQLKRKIKAVLKLILDDPAVGKSLKDELKELKSFRVSRFRIIYRVSSEECIEIVAVGPRKTIYEETLKLLKKEEDLSNHQEKQDII
jgi:mRNA interferase RelE/StbE